MKLDRMSGNIALDRAAWGSVTGSTPFAPIPPGFTGELGLRLYFFYNLSPEVACIRVVPADARVPAGSSLQFSATVNGVADATVAWKLLGPDCSKIDCGTISQSGLYTAPANVQTSPVITVQATSRSEPRRSLNAHITVVPANPSH
jgi:hypothetical protein